jgi:hypothetical protein
MPWLSKNESAFVALFERETRLCLGSTFFRLYFRQTCYVSIVTLPLYHAMILQISLLQDCRITLHFEPLALEYVS